MNNIFTQSATVITILASYFYFIGFLSFIIYLGNFGLNVESFSRGTFNQISVGVMSLFVTLPPLGVIVFWGTILGFFISVYKKTISGFKPYYFLFCWVTGGGIIVGVLNGSVAAESIESNSVATIVTKSKKINTISGNIIHQDATKIAVFTQSKDVLVIPFSTIDYYSIKVSK